MELTTLNADDSAQSENSTWRDSVGIVASIGCAIHCAAMPFVIAYLPALGLSFLADESFHKWMALACFLIAIMAFVPGLRKHRNWTPVSIAVVGLVMITYAAFGLEGSCCASCSEASHADNTTAVAGLSDIRSKSDCPCCESCESCSTNPSDETQSAVATSAGPVSGDWLSTLAPWVTPLGGIILVSAHLMNRRYGCLCGCCGQQSD